MTEISMPLWTGRNYFGPRFDDYYVMITRTRDSGILTESNWRSVVRYLEHHPHVCYSIKRFSHWAVGWIEQILIYKGDSGSVSFCNNIYENLQDYPVFDEEDYSDLEWEKETELLQQIRNDIDTLDIDEELNGWEPVTKAMSDEEIRNIIEYRGWVHE